MNQEFQVISSHPLIVQTLNRILSRGKRLRGRFSSVPFESPSSIAQQTEPRLFILDTCSLPLELTGLCRFLRVRCLGSKFLAMLPPEAATEEEMLRLLYVGIDGVLGITENFEEELPQAVKAILAGNLWMPQYVIREYIRQTNLLLDTHLRPDPPLTAREIQIFQLMVRRLSNREISEGLKIAERTVKFHISNIFAKIKVQCRRELLATMKLPTETEPLTLSIPKTRLRRQNNPAWLQIIPIR